MTEAEQKELEKKAKKAARDRAYAKAYYEANKEKIAYIEKITANRKAYRESNKEKIAARRKERYAANKEKIAARYRANKEKINAGKLIRRAANMQRDAFNTMKRGAKKRKIQFGITYADYLQAIKDTNMRCTMTGDQLEWVIGSQLKPSIDRIDSSRGYTKDNIQVVAVYVNLAKRDMTQEQFIEMGHKLAANNPRLSA